MIGLTRAPDLPGPGRQWLNTDGPVSLADLRGRLVLLDFWTFCCINCIQSIPTLTKLAQQFPTELALISVHSPKFPHERDFAMAAQAVERYGINHAVVHDPHMKLWEAYCVRAWPTLVLISPEGKVIGHLSGEPHPDLLPQGIADLVDHFFASGRLRPAPRRRERISPPPSGGLRFPGKIKPGPAACGKTWVAADSGHNQIVMFADDGSEIARFGEGGAGRRDGGRPLFDGPEGLCCDERFIYAADTRNHQIRRIDPICGTAVTLAGQGWRGCGLGESAPGISAVLASPWDLDILGDNLYFANAGSHQLGVLNLNDGTVKRLAGSGCENLSDGPADQCSLAQPSGLALDAAAGALFFTDSESSALRRMCLTSGRIDTLVGGGLFDYGRGNGSLAQARFQHPLGLCLSEDLIFVADSYNNIIRVVDPEGDTVMDLHAAATAGLCEPAGIAADGPHRLLLADTNNHRIVELDLRERGLRRWAA